MTRTRNFCEWQVNETEPGRRALAELHDAATALRAYAAVLLDPGFRKTAAGEMPLTTGVAAADSLRAAIGRVFAAEDDARAYILGRSS